MPLKLFSLILFIMSLPLQVFSVTVPHLSLHHMEAASGTYNNLITSLHKHSNGMLWIGTSSGLNRYDGYSVQQVTAGLNDTISVLNDYILNIYEDGGGKMWIQTQLGYGIYDPETDFLITDVPEYLGKEGIDGFVTAICSDHKGDVWIAVENNGIYRMKGGEGQAEKVDYDGEGKTSIANMTIDGDTLICVDMTGNLIFVDTGTLKVASRVDSVPEVKSNGKQNYYLTADKSGRVWIYATHRLMVYDRVEKKWMNDRLPMEGKDGIVKSIFQDRSGRLWIARDHHGLELIDYENGVFKFVSTDPSEEITENTTVTCFLEDSHGTIWIGTYKKGLMSYNDSVTKFSLENFPDVNCVIPAGDAWMWVGTDSSGLWKWNTITGEKVSFKDPADGVSVPAITALAADSDGRVYIGSFSRGLRRYYNNKFERIITGTALDSNYLWSLTMSADGKLWAGTLGGGVFSYDPTSGEVTEFNESDTTLPSNYVMSGITSRDGKQYFGTSYGIAIADPATGKLMNFKEVFPEFDTDGWKVTQLYEDSRGLLWVGTASGLKVIDRTHGKIIKVDLGDQQNNKYVLGIIQDNGGAMWVSVGTELINLRVVYNEKSGELSVITHHYDNRDGLMDCDFNQRSFAKLPSGELVVGGFYGLNRFSPSDIKFNTVRPKVLFTDLYMGGSRIRPGQEMDGRVVLREGLNQGGTVEFSHNPKDFSIYFSTDNYVLPEKTTYEYKLVGYNDEWMMCPPGVNRVTYTNLSPGKYTLLVRAINGDGYESEDPAELKIRVYPPLWASPWAFVIYCVLAIVGIWAIIKIVSKQERKRFERRRHEDAVRKQEEINQLKFKFFTNVSHDLRTPLTLIVSPLEEMIKETTDERQSKRLTLMRSNAMRLLALVNQLLDFRKNEVAGLQLSPTEGDVVAFSKNVCNSFVNLSERKNINLTFYSDRENIYMMFDQDKLEKILMNLLGNAFKFTPAGGRVDVSLEQVGEDNPMLRIKIADTGIGIKDKDKEHIFERFYQVDDNGESHPNMGSGIGLSMVSEYVKLHDGVVRVTDNVDCGSVFIIDIPVRHAERTKEHSADVESQEKERNDIDSRDSENEERDDIQREPGSAKRPVVLVVDDNHDMTEMLRFELENDFDIITASDGNEALKIVENVTPSIILTDLMMPGMDGIELCRRLKADKSTVSIPVIILTAKHDLGVKLEGLTLGADDYITKPFNIDVLKLRIKRLVELTAKGAKRSLIDPEPESIKITPLDEQLIEKAVKYVSDHLDSSELSVEELSESLGMSRVRLYKKVKQITGKTPIEFIRVIRLKRAAQLLRESQLNVSEIAYRTGFNSPKVFSKYFKEEFGILPSVYQSQEGSETNYTV
ncbi:MAG: response regulator [Muribaculaceae bacterium]|nr:response regulator [Muribaculaceae bacterium]